jgi:hypothetical protein
LFAPTVVYGFKNTPRTYTHSTTSIWSVDIVTPWFHGAYYECLKLHVLANKFESAHYRISIFTPENSNDTFLLGQELIY